MVNEKVFREMQCRVPLESGDDLKAAFVSSMLKEAAFVLRDGGKRLRAPISPLAEERAVKESSSRERGACVLKNMNHMPA